MGGTHCFSLGGSDKATDGTRHPALNFRPLFALGVTINIAEEFSHSRSLTGKRIIVFFLFFEGVIHQMVLFSLRPIGDIAR